MSEPARRRTLLRYSVTAVVLLGLVAWLANLQRNWDLEARAIASGVVVKDLTDEIRRIDSAADKGAVEPWLLETRFGGLQLVAPSTTEIAPLHIDRVSHEAILTVSGKLATTHMTVREGTASRQTFVPNATTLVSYAPYTAHGWAKLAASDAGVALVFSSAPYAAPPTQVRDDDDRIALGSLPDVFDAEQLLAQLRESGLPSIHRQLPALEGRIAVVAVSSEIAIEPRSGPSAFWVVSGRGRTLGPVDQALAANHLAVVVAQTPLRIAAQPGAPLLLVDYQPDRLEMTSIFRKEKKLYSQWNEELLIRDFFGDRRDGTFLDVGCADYKRLSTTYYLEERLGWSGGGRTRRTRSRICGAPAAHQVVQLSRRRCQQRAAEVLSRSRVRGAVLRIAACRWVSRADGAGRRRIRDG
jgi:hypothetical protein